MERESVSEINYCIFDPTGNITALVESRVDTAKQPAVASKIMDRHPEVEQVGFVYLAEGKDTEVQAILRMAGGEFCGNATMCTAALYMIRRELYGDSMIDVAVSGATEPLRVSLSRKVGNSFDASVLMPPALGIDSIDFECAMESGAVSGSLPVVRMEGIDHIVIEPESAFYALTESPERAESALRKWCARLQSDCLGMMFLGGEGSTRKLVPLVYVPGADTVFWENSCASGSAAAGMYLASKSGALIDCTLNEPAGDLRVRSDNESGGIRLYGSVKLMQ